jgi:abhydrolase domain-containing protein 1/3
VSRAHLKKRKRPKKCNQQISRRRAPSRPRRRSFEARVGVANAERAMPDRAKARPDDARGREPSTAAEDAASSSGRVGGSAFATAAAVAAAAGLLCAASPSSSSSSSARRGPRSAPDESGECEPFVVHGGGALTRELVARCPSLRRDAKYHPPRWLRNAHAQTLAGYARTLTIFLKYDRQIVRCADGGQVGLDWLVRARFGRGGGPPPPPPPPPSSKTRRRTVTADDIPPARDLPPTAPVFIMLHGINGGSHEGPTKWAIAVAASRGWRCVALNLRGCNGVKLASPKVYCAASSEDVRAAVDASRARFPRAPVLLAGYSLGTYVIGTYLAEEDSKPKPPGPDGDEGWPGVAAAVLVSCPMDPHSSHRSLSDPERPAGMMYNGAIASELRRYFARHRKNVAEHPDIEDDAFELSSMRTIRAFEESLIVKTHGFKDVEEYYAYFSPARIIPSIRTPTLYLSARDDPFTASDSVEVERVIRGTAHVALAHVAKGGHVAFLERGVGLFGPCWTDRVLGEFLAAALEERSEDARAAHEGAGTPAAVARRTPAAALKAAGGGEGGVDAAATDGPRSHADPRRGVHIMSKL